MSRFAHFELVGTTPHRHEQEALDWLGAALPIYAPHGGYGLFSFQTDDGRRYEVNAVVMTAHALYVVEIKSWSGKVVEGDVRHLVTRSAERGREVANHPLPLTETKTKALMERVRRVARRLGRDVADEMDGLRFEPLVWLSHAEGIELGEHDAARAHVIVGRHALVHRGKTALEIKLSRFALAAAGVPGGAGLRAPSPRRASTFPTPSAR